MVPGGLRKVGPQCFALQKIAIDYVLHGTALIEGEGGNESPKAITVNQALVARDCACVQNSSMASVNGLFVELS